MQAGLRHVGVLLAVLLVPGCSLLQEPSAKQVEGPTDGYLAGQSLLKVYVRSNSSGDLVLVDFDRRDWYVAKIADAIDHHAAEFLTVTGTPRLIGEYLVESVESPSELNGYRYDKMGATTDERDRMDAEYDALLARVAQAANATTPSAPPTLPIQLPPR